MKRLFLIYLILVAFIFEANAQSEGDFRTRQSGNYSLNTTWQIYSSGSWVNAGSGVIPNTSDHNVTILSNHAVTLNGNYTIKQLVIESNGELNFLNDNSRTLTLISDLVVEANGLIQPSITPSGANRTCTIVIGGNALIDGITDAINYSASYESRLFFTFNGGADNTLSGSGTIGLYDLTINKGSDTTSTLSVNTTINLSAANATDEQRLTLSNGTLKLNAANAWIPYADNNKTYNKQYSNIWACTYRCRPIRNFLLCYIY